ncbi:MAG: GNAT family N-acetyltransferase [Oscillospiraceae bacterium]|nr:GNAT family N-acetyltransferase [Oscillospiraceae bacterium]
MTETRWARPSDTASVKNLWREAFPGEEPYLDCYFRTRYRPEETLLLTKDGAPACMLAGLPMEAVLPEGRRLPGAYLYGVATRKDCRRQGLCTALLAEADRRFADRGPACLFLVPATDTSRAVFRGAGYRDAFALRTYRQAVGELPASSAAEPLSPEDYGQRREALLRGRYFIGCDAAALGFALRFARVAAGGFYGTDEGCALAERLPDGGVLVRELLTVPGGETATLAAVAAALPGSYCQVRTPAWLSGDRGDVRWFGMDRPLGDTVLPDEPGWLGIAYD